MRSSLKWGLGAVLLLSLLVVLGLVGLWWQDNRRPNFTRTAEIYIYPGTTSDEAFELICQKAGVRSRRSLERVFRAKEVEKYITAGHYTIVRSNTSAYVARMLNNGWQSPVRLTLSGNLRIKGNIASKISSQMLLDSATVYGALVDDSLLCGYGFNSGNVFSLLSVTTLEVYWTAGVKDILSKFKALYDAFWTSERISKASTLGLTPLEVSTLASIVSAESNNSAEMPKIAGVYLNRLKLGMPLQADPTVAFCFDYVPERILLAHLEVDSPYNTYKHTGLPPGPICVPTPAALKAVLEPDFGGAYGFGGNLYFCANSDFSGSHVFARTLREHSSNARKFQQELSRRARERK